MYCVLHVLTIFIACIAENRLIICLNLIILFDHMIILFDWKIYISIDWK